MNRRRIREKEELMMALAEVYENCENQEEMSLEDLLDSLDSEESDCVDSGKWLVKTDLYYEFMYFIDLLDRISRSKRVSFKASDVIEYNLRHLASLYCEEEARTDRMPDKGKVYMAVLENFNFEYSVGYGDAKTNKHQRRWKAFKTKYLQLD